MKQHKHAKILETTVHHIQLSIYTIHPYKVKAHAGILENECAERCHSKVLCGKPKWP